MEELQRQIELVKSDLLSRFPNCSYTVIIRLWDDNTSKVECRYGDGEKIYKSIYYNNELTFDVHPSDNKFHTIDEFGNEKKVWLVDEKPIKK